MNLFSSNLIRLEGTHFNALIRATLEEPRSLVPSPLPNDPLVNHQWQQFPYIAAIVFSICLIAIVGIVSKKVEHAIAAALVASFILISLFFLASR